jgi:DNA-binding transcriptional LysR family regulator
MHLLPIAIEFLDSYPDIALRVVLTDGVVNTVTESINVAIRIGTLPDSSMNGKQHRLGSYCGVRESRLSCRAQSSQGSV